MACGIYVIENKVNNKIYIGQAIDIEGRWKSHRVYLNGGYHANKHLQRSWNKYGEKNFEFNILIECGKSQLNTYEQYYIFELMTYDPRIGYNKNYGGDSGRHTEETKKKMSKNHANVKGENNPMYGKTGENNPNYGRHHTEETKKKMSKNHANVKGENHPNYGKHYSEETKKKMSKNHANVKGENHPMYGKHHTEETKKKMSESHKGENISEETKKKMSEANKGENNPMYGKTGENNPKSKTVAQINPNTNEIINTYSGTREASRQTGFSQSAISACCSNKYGKPGNNIYKGFKWMFLSNYEKLNRKIN